MDSKKYCLFSVLMLAILIFSASAMAGELEINKITIYVDDEQKVSTSGNSASLEVQRGDELEISIELENNFDYDTENHMYDVDVEAIIYDIDDGDDLDESATVTVRADRSKTVTLRMDIPDDASPYETYDLEIRAEGKDQDGTRHTDSIMIEIDVDREEPEDDEEEDDYISDAEYNFYREQEEVYRGPSAEERWEQEYQQLVRDRDVIEVVMYEESVIQTPIQSMAVLPEKEEQEGDGFSIFVLVLAMLAVIAFILILVWSWYNS
jgi:hypothetical protein